MRSRSSPRAVVRRFRALYGVWASRSGGVAVQLEPRRSGRVLAGRCALLRSPGLDRALVVADAAGAPTPSGFSSTWTSPRPGSSRCPVVGAPPPWRMPTRWTSRSTTCTSPTATWSGSPAGTSTGPASCSVVRASRPCGGAGGRGARPRARPPAPRPGRAPARARRRTARRPRRDGRPPAADRRGCRRRPGGDHGLAVGTVRSAVERAAREVVDRAPGSSARGR